VRAARRRRHQLEGRHAVEGCAGAGGCAGGDSLPGGGGLRRVPPSGATATAGWAGLGLGPAGAVRPVKKRLRGGGAGGYSGPAAAGICSAASALTTTCRSLCPRSPPPFPAEPRPPPPPRHRARRRRGPRWHRARSVAGSRTASSRRKPLSRVARVPPAMEPAGARGGPILSAPAGYRVTRRAARPHTVSMTYDHHCPAGEAPEPG
jgi:hypothetical protein